MKMQLVSLVLLFSLQNSFLMGMQHSSQQPSVPPAVGQNPRRLMEAQVSDSYYPGYDTYMVQGNSNTVVGTVTPLQNEEGLVIAASKKGFERQNLGHASANVAYFFDKITGLFSPVELQNGQTYEFNGTKNKLNPISRKNWIESSREMINGFAKENILLQTLGFIGCARSVGCLVWALGNPVLTSQYLAWYLTVAVGSSALSKISATRGFGATESVGLACLGGTIIGMLYRNS